MVCFETRVYAITTASWASGEIQTEPVTGLRSPLYPHFGIHLADTGLLVVTHLPTGKMLCGSGFRSIASVVTFLERIAPLKDWSTTEITKPQLDALHNTFVEITQ